MEPLCGPEDFFFLFAYFRIFELVSNSRTIIHTYTLVIFS